MRVGVVLVGILLIRVGKLFGMLGAEPIDGGADSDGATYGTVACLSVVINGVAADSAGGVGIGHSGAGTTSGCIGTCRGILAICTDGGARTVVGVVPVGVVPPTDTTPATARVPVLLLSLPAADVLPVRDPVLYTPMGALRLARHVEHLLERRPGTSNSSSSQTSRAQGCAWQD